MFRIFCKSSFCFASFKQSPKPFLMAKFTSSSDLWPLRSGSESFKPVESVDMLGFQSHVGSTSGAVGKEGPFTKEPSNTQREGKQKSNHQLINNLPEHSGFLAQPSPFPQAQQSSMANRGQKQKADARTPSLGVLSIQSASKQPSGKGERPSKGANPNANLVSGSRSPSPQSQVQNEVSTPNSTIREKNEKTKPLAAMVSGSRSPSPQSQVQKEVSTLSSVKRKKKKQAKPLAASGSNQLAPENTQIHFVKRRLSASEDIRILRSELDLDNQVHPHGFHTEILDFYVMHKATAAGLKARQDIIRKIEKGLRSNRAKLGCNMNDADSFPIKIEPFGSIRFGLATDQSDLDLCLLDMDRPEGFSEKFYRNGVEVQPRLRKVYDMRVLAEILRRLGFSKVTPIVGAAVPIVKFEKFLGRGETIHVDLNTNEQFGVHNSRMIDAYCNLNPYIRPFCMFIKHWAKQRGLNDAAGASGIVTFSSYSLILLAISYLQHRHVLPDLQDPGYIAESGIPRRRFWSRPRRPLAKRRVQPNIAFDVTFVTVPPAKFGWKPPNALDLRDLARGFFEFWGEKFNNRESGVTIRGLEPTFSRRWPYESKHVRKPYQIAKAIGDEEQIIVAQGIDLSEVEKTEGDLKEERIHIEPSSRSSSPISDWEYEEPKQWSGHPILIQDPFVLNRNTCGNILLPQVLMFVAELQRAKNLIDQEAPLSEICMLMNTGKPEKKKTQQLVRRIVIRDEGAHKNAESSLQIIQDPITPVLK